MSEIDLDDYRWYFVGEKVKSYKTFGGISYSVEKYKIIKVKKPIDTAVLYNTIKTSFNINEEIETEFHSKWVDWNQIEYNDEYDILYFSTQKPKILKIDFQTKSSIKQQKSEEREEALTTITCGLYLPYQYFFRSKEDKNKNN